MHGIRSQLGMSKGVKVSACIAADQQELRRLLE
jgi:hypothetical protein